MELTATVSFFFLFLLSDLGQENLIGSCLGLPARLNFVAFCPGVVTCRYIGLCPAGLISGNTLVFILCCFVITVHWSLLKQQDLDTVIIIKVSYFGSPFTFWSLSVRAILNFLGLLWPCLLGRQATCAFFSYRID